MDIGEFCSEYDNLVENKKEPLIFCVTKGFKNMVISLYDFVKVFLTYD